ncbi:Retrovirus-related Pol polyprotein from transposon [Dictyocoela muelleri]|nr:Retrovirus-related Pol polyprotein from transposon [Dictyocoela muelleri]
MQIISFDKDLTTRKQRWKILLQEYYYESEYVEGKRNNSADILSRISKQENKRVINSMNPAVVNKYEQSQILAYIEAVKKLNEEKRNKNEILRMLKGMRYYLTHPGYYTLKETLGKFDISPPL